MNSNTLNSSVRKNIEIYWLILVILSYVFRAAFPILKYFFIILYFTALIYSLVFFKDKIITSLNRYISGSLIVFIVFFFYLAAAVCSDKAYQMVLKDLINAIILASVFLVMTITVTTRESFKVFYLGFIKIVIIFAGVFSLLDLLDLFNILSFNSYFQGNRFLNSSFSDNLSTDPNFALIPIFFALIGILYLLPKTSGTLKKIVFNLLLIIFVLNIYLSGSRRGLMVIFIIYLVLAFLIFLSVIKKGIFTSDFRSGTIIFLAESFLITIALYFFVFQTSYNFKNEVFGILGGNKSIIRSNISNRIIRYVNTININVSEYDLNKFMWSFDPLDPDSGWGKGKYRKISPLTGKNVEIVPKGAIGYLLDSTAMGEKTDIGYYSATKIGNSEVNQSDIQESNVYCYVSEEFNGDAVSLLSEGSTFGIKESRYDLNERGIWKRLSISPSCNKGDASVYLLMSKNGVKDFSSLKGYVIFAYPEYKIVPKKKSHDLSLNCHDLNSINYYEKHTAQSLQELMHPKYNLNGIFQYSDSAYASHKNVHQFISTDTSISNLNKSNRLISSASLIFLPSFSNNFSTIRNDKDPIRRFISNLVSEDTTYHPYKSIILVDAASNRFTDLRILRWQFAMKIYIKEFNINQKLFGGGFNYLNWFGYYFDKDKTMSDYPHNPFLSVLLYSGILGLIFYLLLILKVFVFYFKYKINFPVLPIFFIITFFFSFFSANSPFDPPVMGFFIMLPFFMHSIHAQNG